MQVLKIIQTFDTDPQDFQLIKTLWSTCTVFDYLHVWLYSTHMNNSCMKNIASYAHFHESHLSLGSLERQVVYRPFFFSNCCLNSRYLKMT